MTLPVVFTANGPSGYNLTNSLRFRQSASAYLNRTPASAGNRQTWTWSGWVKRGTLGTYQQIFGAYIGSGTTDTNYFEISFLTDLISITGYSTVYRRSTAVYRDPSAWYHIIVAMDTTQATAANRVKVYVNGSEVTAFGTSNNPTQNTNLGINGAYPHGIGAIPANASYFDGYQTEVNFIDGQALTPSSFGETSATTGVWIPKKYSGTYGTNGFYLPFTDNSALTTSSNVGLGKDFSGNANYWTTNNISITAGTTYDSMTDVPTLTSTTAANFCVFNPVIAGTTNLINGNLTRNGAVRTNVGTMFLTGGKYYFETTIQDSNGNGGVGVKQSTAYPLEGYDTSKCATYFANGEYKIEGASQTSGFSSFTNGDIIGIAVDTTQSPAKIWFAKNNTWQGTGNPTTAGYSLTSGLDYYFMVLHGSGSSSTTASSNFGQQGFTYTPPTGFVALNTFNLPTPTIGATASTTANKYFDATLYTGNGTTNVITNAGSFQPDFVWCKSRSAALFHGLYDSVRGAGSTKGLYSNDTVAEGTYSNFQNLVSFNSNGFTLGATSSQNNINENGTTFVGWQWRASNATAVTNTAGSITSTVSANTTAGFSIVTYTGTGANATVGHGLGVAPSMVIVKNRSAGSTNWCVYHISVGNQFATLLNSTSAPFSNSNYWNNTTPTSSVFSLGNGTDTNGNTNNLVAYCFAPIAGYSAFGSYTGNGSTDGPFVFTGFRPKFVMVKNTVDPNNWILFDTARNTYNIVDLQLYPNTSDAEVSGGSSNGIDFLSNGFKVRSSNNWGNRNGDTIIYACFAENPFKYANAR